MFDLLLGLQIISTNLKLKIKPEMGKINKKIMEQVCGDPDCLS